MTRPAYCPNCAAQLEGENATVALEDAEGRGGYDCYCVSCRWSGDIYPDDEAV